MGIFNKTSTGKIMDIDVDMISPNPSQPRMSFDEVELMSLAISIKANGILQPLTLRVLKNGAYELISGERRLRAAKMIGMENVPCILLDRDERQSAILALMENIQRQDLNFFEEAAAIGQLILEWNITQEEAAMRLGKAQSTIANKLRLLRLTKGQRVKILENGLTERHARALIKIPDEQLRDKAIYYIINRKINVAQTEEYINTLLKAQPQVKNRVTIPVIKDVRLFLNTINKAIDTMQKAGVAAQTQKISTEDCIEYIVRIPLKSPV